MPFSTNQPLPSLINHHQFPPRPHTRAAGTDGEKYFMYERAALDSWDPVGDALNKGAESLAPQNPNSVQVRGEAAAVFKAGAKRVTLRLAPIAGAPDTHHRVVGKKNAAAGIHYVFIARKP